MCIVICSSIEWCNVGFFGFLAFLTLYCFSSGHRRQYCCCIGCSFMFANLGNDDDDDVPGNDDDDEVAGNEVENVEMMLKSQHP